MRKALPAGSFAFCAFLMIAAFSQSSQWQEYVYAEDGFAISAPSKPGLIVFDPKKDVAEPYKRSIPKTATTKHMYAVALGLDSGLTVTYWLLSPEDKRTPEQVLADEKKLFNDIISEKPVALGKFPGIEIEGEFDGRHIKRRTYLVGRKLYALAGLSTRANKALPDELQRWYDSFRLVDPQK